MDDDTDDLPLFKRRVPATGKAMELGMEALTRTSLRERNARLIEQLIPVAQRLARERATVTVADLRLVGCAEGILDAEDKTLDFLGAVMRRAGLVNTGQVIRNTINRSHGRHLVVWCAATLGESNGKKGNE